MAAVNVLLCILSNACSKAGCTYSVLQKSALSRHTSPIFAKFRDVSIDLYKFPETDGLFRSVYDRTSQNFPERGQEKVNLYTAQNSRNIFLYVSPRAGFHRPIMFIFKAEQLRKRAEYCNA